MCQIEGGCEFFMWIDEGVSSRAKEAFNILNQKKILVEEKLKIAEEKLKIAEEKLKMAKEKLKITNEKLQKITMKKIRKAGKQSKFLPICIMLTVVVVVVGLVMN